MDRMGNPDSGVAGNSGTSLAVTVRFVRANEWLDEHPRIVVAAAVVMLALFAVALTWDGVANYNQNARLDRLARAGANAQDALCVFRDDLARRIDQTRDFLADHPNGIPGIDGGVLRNSLKNQQQTLDALSVLRCE